MQMKKFFLLLFLLTFLSACSLFSAEEDPVDIHSFDPQDLDIRSFQVESIEVDRGEQAPTEVTARITGTLGDDCTEIYAINRSDDENHVTLEITTARPRDRVCASVLVERIETLRLGTFENDGNYFLFVNDKSLSFLIGEPPAAEFTGYEVEINQAVTTPDGGLTVLLPEDWVVATNPGSIRVADSPGTLNDPFNNPGAYINISIGSGPYKIPDLGMDGDSISELYVFFSIENGGLHGPPRRLQDAVWEGLGGHVADQRIGEQDLKVLEITEETRIAIASASPLGEWELFEPLVNAVIASIQIN
jgi:hypothetical protein